MLFRIFSFFIIVGCSACRPSVLESALERAGENRIELERVLRHYSEEDKDSLKWEAARFLIENMPGHLSIGGDSIGPYYAALNAVFSNDTLRNWQDSLDKIHEYYKSGLRVQEDIKVIKSGFLIANIDSAFRVWREKPWASHVGFDDFCEYILPYTVGQYQPLEDWRKKFATGYEEQIDLRHPRLSHSAFWAATWVNREIGTQIRFQTLEPFSKIPLLFPSLLPKSRGGSCREYALMGLSIMRSKGSPVMMDFIPQWPVRSGRHYWNVMLDNRGKNVVFLATESDPGMPHKVEEKLGKVYRQTYAINRDLERLNRECGDVPDFFQNCFMKDVTAEYMRTSDVEIEVPSSVKCSENYAYLTIFDNEDWVPVDWAGIHRGKALFKNVARDIVYLPVYYTSDGLKPLASPFLLDTDGKVIVLKGDTLNRQQLKLYRKYPPSDNAYAMGRRIVGGKIQAANRADFSDSVTIYRVPEWKSAYSLKVTTDTAWRYWRYLSAENGLCNIAELVFYQRDSMRPIVGEIIGTEGSCFNDPNHVKEKVFDGDPLTFFDAPTGSGAWVGMDFGKEVNIGKLIFIPRTDGNMIQLGDTYELYWWGPEGWQLIGGPRIARDVVLEYLAPSNALYWLRDVSRGREERIFTYSDGKQIFW